MPWWAKLAGLWPLFIIAVVPRIWPPSEAALGQGGVIGYWIVMWTSALLPMAALVARRLRHLRWMVRWGVLLGGWGLMVATIVVMVTTLNAG